MREGQDKEWVEFGNGWNGNENYIKKANSNKQTVPLPKNSETFAHLKVGYPTVAMCVVVMNGGKKGQRQTVR